MKQQPQVAFTSQSDFSKLKVAGAAAQDNTNIELAIYDLMVDGASRTVNQIVRTLAVLGYEASQINNRMVGLLFKKEWFVEGTLSGKPSYKLKKTAKRTIALTTAAKGLESVKASDIVVRSSAEQPFSSASKTPQAVEVTYKRNRSLNAKENTMPQEPTPQPADKPVQHIVLPEDPVRLAVWKVMADHAYYKRNDLAQLLDHINLSTISAVLILMEDEGMLEVDRADRKTGFLFRLREGVAAPEGGLPYNPRDRTPKAAPPQPELPLENQPMQSNVPEGNVNPDNIGALDTSALADFVPAEIRAKAAEISAGLDNSAAEPSAMQILANALGASLQPHMVPVQPKEVAAPDGSATRNVADFPGFEVFRMSDQPKEVAPLIAVGGIQIKGIAFSYKEARELLHELRRFGFGSESYYQAAPITLYVKMVRSFSVSGMAFTEFEMNSLALSLAEELE